MKGFFKSLRLLISIWATLEMALKAADPPCQHCG